jgi:hypothetical protein
VRGDDVEDHLEARPVSARHEGVLNRAKFTPAPSHVAPSG